LRSKALHDVRGHVVRDQRHRKIVLEVVEISSLMTVVIEIDQEACIQCGKCYGEECPEVFKEGSDGTAEIAEKYQDGSTAKGKVPDDLLDCTTKAAEACPVSVITVTKS
jgi:ferredoxin